MNDSPLTLATDGAYGLNALLVICQAALDATESLNNPKGTAEIVGAVSRTLRDVAIPMVGQSIDALETAERLENSRVAR